MGHGPAPDADSEADRRLKAEHSPCEIMLGVLVSDHARAVSVLVSRHPAGRRGLRPPIPWSGDGAPSYKDTRHQPGNRSNLTIPEVARSVASRNPGESSRPQTPMFSSGAAPRLGLFDNCIDPERSAHEARTNPSMRGGPVKCTAVA